MMDAHNDKHTQAAAEARFAYQVASRLSEGNADLPLGVAERLEAARRVALARGAGARRRSLVPAWMRTWALADAGGHAGNDAPWRLGIGLALAIPTLLVGLYALQHFQQERFVHRIADIDTAVLLDDLPPQAYVDPGFRSYLRQGG